MHPPSAPGSAQGDHEPAAFFIGMNALRLAADRWGRKGDPAVVLLHGGGQTRHSWRKLGALLAQAGYHAIAYDARGHGDSDWAPAGCYGSDEMIEDLREVLRSLGDVRPVIVGASMGGRISMIGLGEKRIHAAGLVLVDVAPTLSVDGNQRVLAFMGEYPDGFDSVEQAAEFLSTYQPQRRPSSANRGLRRNLRLQSNGKYRWHWDPAFLTDPRDWEAIKSRMMSAVAAIDVPLMLVSGSLSDVMPEESVKSFLAICPHARHVNVKGASHMVAGDDNTVFNEAVLDFIETAVKPV